MVLKGQNEGSCYVLGKLSNFQGILMVIFQPRGGDKYVGELFNIVLIGEGKIDRELYSKVSG